MEASIDDFQMQGMIKWIALIFNEIESNAGGHQCKLLLVKGY